MCGIAGLIGTPLSDARRAATLAALAHRGPDADGVASGRLGDVPVTLLHTRLAIIDLDPRADQPLRRDGLTLVYNGELYNFLELKAELAGLGHYFATDSDTEVVLEAYRCWGPDCARRFDGMWALALLDEPRGRLWLSRDRFGEKPLFWMRHGDTLAFASEVKALAALTGARPTPDRDQLRRFLVNGYRVLHKQPATWFRDIHALPAGTSAVLAADSPTAPPTPTPYWQLSFAPRPMGRAEAVDGVRARLLDGLERRLRADVPLAFCLSGGIDSGLLAGMAAKRLGADVHGFSVVDSDPRYDERDTLAETVAFLGCRHTTIRTGTDGFLDRMSRLVADHDGPVITISYYVHALLAEAIAEAGYKVAISGTGADELFTGYHDHYVFWLAGQVDRPGHAERLAQWRAGYGASVRNPLLQDPARFVKQPGCRDHITQDRARFNALLRDPCEEPFTETEKADDLLRNRMLNELETEVVPVILAEDDLNSMRVSVENRSPFLDPALAEFAFSVPTELLIHDGLAKWLLRAAGEGVMADTVRLDARKRGFNASIDSLLDRNDPEVRERLLTPGPIFEIIDRERFTAFLDGDMTDNSLSKFLFSFVSTRLFLDHAGEAA